MSVNKAFSNELERQNTKSSCHQQQYIFYIFNIFTCVLFPELKYMLFLIFVHCMNRTKKPGIFSKRKGMTQIIKKYVPESKQANQCSDSAFCTP